MEKKRFRILEKSILGMIIMCVLISLAVSVLGMDRSESQVIDPDSIIGDITTASGDEHQGLTPDEWRLSGGDLLEADIKLPDDAPFSDSSLCFTIYNAEIQVYYGNVELYSYGKKLAEERKQIGNVFVIVPIPLNAWGKSFTLKVKEQEITSTLQNTSFTIVPSSNARNFPIVGHGLEFVIFFVLMIVGCIIGLAGLLYASNGKNRIIMVSIGAATFLLCCWYFGYNRFFYAISTNMRVNAMAEYYSIDLVSLPIILFVYTVMSDGFRKKIVRWVGICVGAYCLGSLALSVFRVIRLSDTLPGLQVILTILLGILLYLVISGAREDKSGLATTMLVGFTTGMGFAVLEIIAIRIRNISGFPRALLGITNFNYASVGLAILILTLIIGVVEQLYRDMRERTEQEELRKIAYIDQLTGVPNRISCTNQMRELTEDEWYAVAFFDVDGLKKANDNFGHDVGDELIREAADVISQTFRLQKGFFGRWGGDEFVAVFLDKASYVKFDLEFGKNTEHVARDTRLPIPFSISVGYMEHMPGSALSINDVVNQADERMYYNKKLKKKERTE